jgi:hypothetical protein
VRLIQSPGLQLPRVLEARKHGQRQDHAFKEVTAHRRSHHPLHVGISPSPAVDSNIHRNTPQEVYLSRTINKKQVEKMPSTE